MRLADPSLTAAAVGIQDESAQGVRTVPRRRTAPTPAAAVAYMFAWTFAAGGVGVALTLGVFLEETGGPVAPSALIVEQIACVFAGLVTGAVSLAIGRGLHHPGNEVRVITTITVIGLPLMLLGWAWVLSAGF